MTRQPKFVTIVPTRDCSSILVHDRARAAISRSRLSTRIELARTVTV